jgi:hypothetical protein
MGRSERVALGAICLGWGAACNAIVGLNGFHDVPGDGGPLDASVFPGDTGVTEDAPDDADATVIDATPPPADTGPDVEDTGSGFPPNEAGNAVDLRWPRWRMPNAGGPDSGLPNLASYERVSGVDGGVIDRITGLDWGNVTTGVTTIGAASAACASPWRLPTRIELVSILDTSGAADSGVLVNAAFASMQPLRFWTSSTTPSGVAWTVDFGAGAIAPSPTASAVICVYVGGDGGGS